MAPSWFSNRRCPGTRQGASAQLDDQGKASQHHPEATEQPGRALVELQRFALPSIGRLPGRKQGCIVVYRTYDRLAVEQLDLFVLPVIDDITGGTNARPGADGTEDAEQGEQRGHHQSEQGAPVRVVIAHGGGVGDHQEGLRREKVLVRPDRLLISWWISRR